MNQTNIVILGGGMVTGYAAKHLVELGLAKGELAILSADNAVPYERPPLSKSFLAGKDTDDSIKINPEEFYEDHGSLLILSGLPSWRALNCAAIPNINEVFW